MPLHTVHGVLMVRILEWFAIPSSRGADSLEKTLMLGKIEGRRRRGQRRMRWFNTTADSMGMSLSKLQETGKEREAWCAAVRGAVQGQTRLSNRTPPPPYALCHVKLWVFMDE